MRTPYDFPRAETRRSKRRPYSTKLSFNAESGGGTAAPLASWNTATMWGSMLNAAQRFLGQAPWMAIFPGLSIFVVVLAFNLLGDGLRDALDPKGR